MEFLYYSALLLLEAYLKEMNSIKSLYANNQSSTIHTAQWQKQSKCPSVGEWVKKAWHTHTRAHHLAIQRNRILIPATARGNLENIKLSQRNQSQESTSYVALFIRKSGTGNSINTEKRFVAA